MTAPFSPKAVANAFLQRAFNDKQPIGQLKLQKLLYLAHGYYLASTNGVPLINEPFEAWDYGPVCRSLYNEFREFGKASINRLATDIDWEIDEFVPAPAPTSDRQADRVIDFVYKTYAPRSAFELSDLTHQPGWAWDKTRSEDKFNLRNKDLDNDLIRVDFAPLIRTKATVDA